MLGQITLLVALSVAKVMESKLVAIVEGLHYEVHRRQGYGAYDFIVVVGPGDGVTNNF